MAEKVEKWVVSESRLPNNSPWDRPHQATLNQSYTFTDELTFNLQGIAGTGAPAIYGHSTQLMNHRLPIYVRWYIYFEFNKALESSTFKAHLSLFNVFNRDNIWYSHHIQADYSKGDETIEIYPQRYVYDLGFYPHFELGIHVMTLYFRYMCTL